MRYTQQRLGPPAAKAPRRRANFNTRSQNSKFATIPTRYVRRAGGSLLFSQRISLASVCQQGELRKETPPKIAIINTTYLMTTTRTVIMYLQKYVFGFVGVPPLFGGSCLLYRYIFNLQSVVQSLGSRQSAACCPFSAFALWLCAAAAAGPC
jgi:hypothetical protein